MDQKSDRVWRIKQKFSDFMKGRHKSSSLTAPSSPPEWLDKEACRRGRQFYHNNIYSNNMGSMDALITGMCIQNFYRPLVISRKTIRKPKSGYRYLETGLMVYSWYVDDIWDPDSLANRMVIRVNAMHKHVADMVRAVGENVPTEVEKVFHDADIDCEAELTEQDRILLAEIGAIREKTDIPQEYYDYVNDSTPFSQVDMALIQGAFFAPYLLYPVHYGVSDASQNELEDFTKLWRIFGYYLGIEDRYNAVLEDFEDSKVYCYLVMENILKPCMLHLDKYAIHMAKTALFLTDYHVLLYSKYRLVGYDLPRLWSSFSLLQRIKYYQRQVWPYIYSIPGVKQFLNHICTKAFRRIFAVFSKRNLKSVCPI